MKSLKNKTMAILIAAILTISIGSSIMLLPQLMRRWFSELFRQRLL